uniref:CSON009577 protein n=1 Tax=Culicoides sonorensis TaxID=179676 RepID=A0A336KEV9_CULSO
MIDIPESGAVFIVGDSGLKNNQENYFFIKNDPVQKIYANYYGQNGVVCESGRLFVWGNNQYGQLGVMGPYKEVITKPTLIRLFKLNKLKVKDVAFGYQFTVVLTENNKIFYCGRSIFPPKSMIFSFKDKFQIHPDTTEFTDTFVEVSEFDFYTELELLEFDRVHAGGNHFVVQTQCGKLIGWGQPGGGQLGPADVYRMSREPMYLGIENVKFVICGNEYTLAMTHGNEVFVTGKFNTTYQMFFNQMNTSSIQARIDFMHISMIEEVCVITDQKDIYISKSQDSLSDFSFHKLKLMEQCDKIVQLESGSNFLSFITETEKFFTNFRDTDDLSEYPEFHELERFSKFRLTAFKCGLNYILVKGIPKAPHTNIGMEISVEDRNGFSQASTIQPYDDNPNLKSPRPFHHATTLHANSIRFIEDGIERETEINKNRANNVHQNVNQYLGPPIAYEIPIHDKRRCAKEETRKMLLAESEMERIQYPVPAAKPRVRIKTPMPREKLTAVRSQHSSGPSTAESDHSVDEELNRVPKEGKIHKFFRELKERAIEFEESCKETNNVVPDDKEIRTANDLAIAKHLPNSFICVIQ